LSYNILYFLFLPNKLFVIIESKKVINMTDVFNDMLRKFLKDNFDYQNIAYNDLFNYFIKNSFDILIIKDLDLKTVWLNRLPYTLSGHNISEVDIRNSPCYRVFFQKSKPCENCPVLKSKNTGKPIESEINTKDGHAYLVRSYPLKNESGGIIGFIEVILNITRKRRLKSELESEKLKIDLFTNLSHEFKTPINMMHSTLQLLEKKLDKLEFNNEIQETFARYFKVIKQNNFRLYKVISNIMDINKINKGYYKHYPQNHNIIEIIKDAVLSCKDYAKKQNKELEFITEIESRTMACDPFDIERIILNLISNSLKFTRAEDSISVTVTGNDTEIKILIKDTGIGIAEECQDKIFDRFNQAENFLTRGNVGSGLGMYIVKFLIEMHGGRIDLDSVPGEWTEFLIRLPVKVLSDKDEQNKEVCQNIDYNMIDRTDIELSDIN